MNDESPDLLQEMHRTADVAAAGAAGATLGKRIAQAHPGLPPVYSWSAYEYSDAWRAGGYLGDELDNIPVRRSVAAYARALGGSEPTLRNGGRGLETVATFEGVEVTIWGIVADSTNGSAS